MQNENSFTNKRFLLTLKINPQTIKNWIHTNIIDKIE